jgi:RNA polymerase sigma factor (sigma-70 family)
MATKDAATQAMESLAESIRAGEESAIRAFQKRYSAPFFYYFRRRGLPEADAADLAASCITDIVLKVRDHFDPLHTCFEAWVYLLRQRAAVDWWRQKRRQPMLELDQELESAAASADVGDETAGIQADAVNAVAEAVSQLNRIDQELIQFRYGGQVAWSFEEIATELERRHGQGYQAATLRQRHTRALSKLRTMVSDDPRLRPVLERVRRMQVGASRRED